MHATMAVFNACATACRWSFSAPPSGRRVKRRPWIDWIHTSRDQGALVRGYTKWDDQPASPVAAAKLCCAPTGSPNTAPRGPTYVNLDAEIQEMKLAEEVAPIDGKRYMPEIESAAPAAVIAKAAELLRNAKTPVILAGRVSRSVEAWNARVALAERLAPASSRTRRSRVVPDRSPLHAGAPGGTVLAQEAQDAIRNADVIMTSTGLTSPAASRMSAR